MRKIFLIPLLMLFLISISCDTSSPEELDKNDILDIFDSIQLSFNIDDLDGIMQNFHQDFFHDGDFNWERDVIWVSRLADYNVLLFEDIEINLNGNYATVSFLMNLDSITFEEPSEDNGDISYFYYDLGSWKVCGEGFSTQP